MADSYTAGAGGKSLVKIENMTVHEECETVFKELKNKRKHRFVAYGIDKNEIRVKDKGAHNVALEDFLSRLPTDKCRYVIYDHEYKTHDGRKADKLVFIVWCPRGAATNFKMLYTTEKPKINNFLTGAVELNAATVGEIREYLGFDAGSDEDEVSDDDAWLDA